MKNYTLKQVADLTSIPQNTLKQQLNRDAKKNKCERKYPHAYKCECGHGWMIPARDLKRKQN